MPDLERLRELIRGDAWIMSALSAVRDTSLPEWAIGAGVFRNLVWDHLHGYAERTPPRDVDVAYFDALDLRPETEQAWEAQLLERLPAVPWEVKNQAAVHLWYPARFGSAVPPLGSLEEAVATWPETATTVAVRLEADDSLTVIAPFGLEDLFGLTLRRNPARVTLEEFHRRLESKRIRERWPRVTVIDG